MDNLIASSSPRALLASSQRRPASLGGAPPLGPGVSAEGKGAAEISSREAYPISVSSRSPSLWGRGVSTTRGFSLFGVEFADACPDVSYTIQDRSSLTSMLMLTSLSTFGGVAFMGLAIRMDGQMPEGVPSVLAPLPWIVGCPL